MLIAILVIQSSPISQAFCIDFLRLDELAAVESVTWTEYNGTGGTVRRILCKLTFGLFYQTKVYYSLTFLGREKCYWYANERYLCSFNNLSSVQQSQSFDEEIKIGNSGSVTFGYKQAKFELASGYTYSDERTVKRSVTVNCPANSTLTAFISDIVVTEDSFDLTVDGEQGSEIVIEYGGGYHLETWPGLWTGSCY